MAFQNSPHEESPEEAFGKAYIRVHAYTPADWSSIRRGNGTLFSEPVWIFLGLCSGRTSPEPELVTDQSPICVSRGKCRHTARKLLRLLPVCLSLGSSRGMGAFEKSDRPESQLTR